MHQWVDHSTLKYKLNQRLTYAYSLKLPHHNNHIITIFCKNSIDIIKVAAGHKITMQAVQQYEGYHTQITCIPLVHLICFGSTSEQSSSMCWGKHGYELDGDQKQLMALEVQTLDVIRPDN